MDTFKYVLLAPLLTGMQQKVKVDGNWTKFISLSKKESRPVHDLKLASELDTEAEHTVEVWKATEDNWQVSSDPERQL